MATEVSGTAADMASDGAPGVAASWSVGARLARAEVTPEDETVSPSRRTMHAPLERSARRRPSIFSHISAYVVFLQYAAGVSIGIFGLASVLITGDRQGAVAMTIGGALVVTAVLCHSQRPSGSRSLRSGLIDRD